MGGGGGGIVASHVGGSSGAMSSSTRNLAVLAAVAHGNAIRRAENATEGARPTDAGAVVDGYRTGMLVIVASSMMCGLMMMVCVACCRRCERRKHRSADYHQNQRTVPPSDSVYTLGVNTDEQQFYNSALMYGAGLEGMVPSIPLVPRAAVDGPPPAYETMFNDTVIDIKKDLSIDDDVKTPYPVEAEDDQQQPPKSQAGTPPSYEAAVSAAQGL